MTYLAYNYDDGDDDDDNDDDDNDDYNDDNDDDNDGACYGGGGALVMKISDASDGDKLIMIK